MRDVVIFKSGFPGKEPIEIGPAKFHRWGQDFEEFDNGAVGVTMAIVELPGGQVMEVLPKFVKFVVERKTEEFIPCAKCGAPIEMLGGRNAAAYLASTWATRYILSCRCGHSVEGATAREAFDAWQARDAK